MSHSVYLRLFLAGALLWCLPAASAAQEVDPGPSAVRISAGDSVRVDGDLVGRVLSLEGSNLTVVSRGEPRCRAGVGHGDAPICDPAPLVRTEMMLGDVEVELRRQKGDPTKRTLVGGALGAAVFGTAGYFLGPEIGFGRIDGCYNATSTQRCLAEKGVTLEEQAANQKRHDQTWGAIFFGAVGATATAIVARRTSVGWVRVEPSVPVMPGDAWGVAIGVVPPR